MRTNGAFPDGATTVTVWVATAVLNPLVAVIVTVRTPGVPNVMATVQSGLSVSVVASSTWTVSPAFPVDQVRPAQGMAVGMSRSGCPGGGGVPVSWLAGWMAVLLNATGRPATTVSAPTQSTDTGSGWSQAVRGRLM